MKKSVLFIALAAVLLSFVSFEEGEESAVPYGYPDSTVKAFLKSQESKYSAIPYFAKLDDQYLFYVVKGKWLDTSLTQFAKGDFLMGIVNERNEVIVPLEYNKIYNPDATARGYIEIEKNGKRGLVNYHTKKIIAAEYDVLFSYDEWACIAIGRKGNKFYKIFEAGRVEEIHFGKHGKWYCIAPFAWNYNQHSITHLIFTTREPNNKYRVASGVIITPSYFYDMKAATEKISAVAFNYQNLYDGVADIELHLTRRRDSKNNLKTFFSEFKAQGIEERGYLIQKNNIVTTDSVGNFHDYISIAEPRYDDGFGYNSISNPSSYEKAYYRIGQDNDSIVEISYLADTIPGMNKYDFFSYYSYYKISPKGKIEKLQSNRLYDCTKYVKMNGKYFKGMFFKPYNRNTDTNGILLHHLDMEDLSLMRNEIYADYGYKFTSDKWKKYFEQQSWYKAKWDDVEPFLTSIDKANLELIKKVMMELSKDEKKFTQPTFVNYEYGW